MGVVVLVAASNHFHTGQDLCAADLGYSSGACLPLTNADVRLF